MTDESSPADLGGRAARGGAMTLISQALKISVMLCSLIVLARLVDPESYGIFAMVMAIIGVADVFRDFGLSMAALQAPSLSKPQQSNLFWINLAIGAVLATTAFLCAGLIAAFYQQPEVALVAQVLGVTFLLNGASTQFKVVINRRLQFGRLALVDLVPYIAAFATALVVAISRGDVWALVAQQLAIATFTLALSIVMSRWLPGLPRRVPMDGLLGFGWRIAATQLIGYAARNVDSIALGRVWGAQAVGLYDRGYQIVMMPVNQLNAPLSRVAIPLLATVRDDRERFQNAVRRSQLIAGYGTSAIFGLLAATGEQVVPLVLGSDWRAAGTIVQILAIGAIFRSLGQVSYWIYVSRGLASQQLRFFMVAQPVLVAVILSGLPFGAIGVAIASSVGLFLYWIASLLWAGRSAEISVGSMFVDAARSLGGVVLPGTAAAYVSAQSLAPAVGPLGSTLTACAVACLVWAVILLLWPRARTDVASLVGFARGAIRRRRPKGGLSE